MRKTIGILILSVLFILPAESLTKSDKDWDKLTGPVRSVIEDHAKVINKSGEYIEIDRKHWRTRAYNLQGKMISENPRPGISGEISAGDVVETRTERDYENNRLIEERTYTKRDNLLTRKTIWKFDDKERNIEWAFYYADQTDGELKLEGKWVSKYDERGNRIEYVRFNGCCSLNHREIADHDDKGNIIEYAYYNSDMSLRSKTNYVYEYDQIGNWVKKTTSVWIKKGDNGFFEPREVSYRQITYAWPTPVKQWRGIIPLQSTRENVEELLGPPPPPPTDGTRIYTLNKGRSIYFLDEGEVYIVYAEPELPGTANCSSAIPAGTVMMIQITPKGALKLSALHLDEQRLKKFDPSDPPSIGFAAYFDEEEGIIIRTQGDKIDQINYIASAKDRQKCPAYYQNPKSFVQLLVHFR